MEDYYSILGLSKTASFAEINSAKRKLLAKYSPDRETGDETMYKKVNEAHLVLSDPKKREVYDRYGKEGLTGLGPTQTKQAPRDVIGHKCTLAELWNATTITIKVPSGNQCSNCQGKKSRCRQCFGTGQQMIMFNGRPVPTGAPCACDGGTVTSSCSACLLGFVPREESIAIRPEDVVAGAVLVPNLGVNGRDLVIKLQYQRPKCLKEIAGPSGLPIFLYQGVLTLAEAMKLRKKVTLSPGIVFSLKADKIISPQKVYLAPVGPGGGFMGLMFSVSYPESTVEELIQGLEKKEMVGAVNLDICKSSELKDEEEGPGTAPQCVQQ